MQMSPRLAPIRSSCVQTWPCITNSPSSRAIRSSLQSTNMMEWLVDPLTAAIHMPDADILSVRDRTAIYEAIAAADLAYAFHEVVRHVRLVSDLYMESKRVTQEILHGVTDDVARRIRQEPMALGAASSHLRSNPEAGPQDCPASIAESPRAETRRPV
jgi:hypothetical protein